MNKEMTVDECRKLTLKKYRDYREIGGSPAWCMKMVRDDAVWVIETWEPTNNIPTDVIEEMRTRAAMVGYWANRYLQTHQLLTD